jgi:hypothetical protein
LSKKNPGSYVRAVLEAANDCDTLKLLKVGKVRRRRGKKYLGKLVLFSSREINRLLAINCKDPVLKEKIYGERFHIKTILRHKSEVKLDGCLWKLRNTYIQFITQLIKDSILLISPNVLVTLPFKIWIDGASKGCKSLIKTITCLIFDHELFPSLTMENTRFNDIFTRYCKLHTWMLLPLSERYV